MLLLGERTSIDLVTNAAHLVSTLQWHSDGVKFESHKAEGLEVASRGSPACPFALIQSLRYSF